MNRILTCICILLLPTFWAFRTVPVSPPPDQQPSATALAYFEAAVSHISQNAYSHRHLTFSDVKQQALAKMKSAQTYANTCDAIRYVLDQLKDRHSCFQPPLTDS